MTRSGGPGLRPGAPSPAAVPLGVASIARALAVLPGARILDVRDEATFVRGHAEGAGRVALDEFVPRRAELPSRETPVLVVHDEPSRAHAAADALAVLGYERVAWLEHPLGSEAGGHVSRAPAARLWSPSAFIEREAGEAARAANARAAQGPGRALDLACGSGRAAVFLALAGWRTEGWDVDASALERARALAGRHGAAVSWSQRDLEERPPEAAEAATFDLIVVVRYLHRPLFPWIERALSPGGVLLYETFRDGQQRFGPPRRARHLLHSGELLTAFPSLVVEHHEETPDDAPPVLARLVARRPG